MSHCLITRHAVSRGAPKMEMDSVLAAWLTASISGQVSPCMAQDDGAMLHIVNLA